MKKNQHPRKHIDNNKTSQNIRCVLLTALITPIIFSIHPWNVKIDLQLGNKHFRNFIFVHITVKVSQMSGFFLRIYFIENYFQFNAVGINCTRVQKRLTYVMFRVSCAKDFLITTLEGIKFSVSGIGHIF